MKTLRTCLLTVFSMTILLDPCSGWSSPPKKSKVLEFGVILRLKDTFNDTLTYTMSGIETAKALFEKAHPGVQVKLKTYTHDDSLRSVLEASQKAIQDELPAVIGGEISEESFVIRHQLGPKKMVFITPTSSNPEVTEGYPYSFRICYSDKWVASEMARFTLTLDPKAVGLIHNVSSPYTDFQSKHYLETFNELMEDREAEDRIPIFEEQVIKDTTQFGQQIRRFIQKGVTHVMLPLHRGDFLRFVTQANMLGYFPVYVGTDGWGSTEHIQRDLFDRSQWRSKFIGFRSVFWNDRIHSALSDRFRSEYLRKTSSNPNSWAAVGFDSAWVLLHAMNKAANPKDGEQIRVELKKIKDFQLVTQKKFAFGPDNSPFTSVPIFRIQGQGSPLEAPIHE